jgi:hypothetical protein
MGIDDQASGLGMVLIWLSMKPGSRRDQNDKTVRAMVLLWRGFTHNVPF